ncbi:unnamed protein product [Penicillium camemberti]|uniref:Str. FM013 n=1 Tax=Penicillium camemberti (strain FM 013) TaxID=1429867 RepID=A0A0G4PWV4_PENC3|nr:unnamed protein product [Penicillium camemberti]
MNTDSVPRNTDSVFRNTRPSPGAPTLSSGSPTRPQEHQSIPRNISPSPGTSVHPQEHRLCLQPARKDHLRSIPGPRARPENLTSLSFSPLLPSTFFLQYGQILGASSNLV